ncbi:cupin domain-containing protein [Stella sp.]|uniref:cupin domain-containing protein n=1 Tax=Stella sp. TaxID=2912054 RepID=UPI0035B4F535
MPNLFDTTPATPAAERTEPLLTAAGVRLERVLSLGQASPPGFWYDQAEAEWVAVLSGRARLAIAGEAHDRELGPGDAVFLPAGCRHRVAWTDPDQPTVWLALFVDPTLGPALGPAPQERK